MPRDKAVSIFFELGELEGAVHPSNRDRALHRFPSGLVSEPMTRGGVRT